MDIPTVLGRVVLVEGCETFPSVQALHALDPGTDRPAALRDTLARLRAYEGALLDLQADTIDTLREQRWPWKWIAKLFKVSGPSTVMALRDRRRILREIRGDDQPRAAA